MKQLLLLTLLLAISFQLVASGNRYRKGFNRAENTSWLSLGLENSFAWTESLSGQVGQLGMGVSLGKQWAIADRIALRTGGGIAFGAYRSYEMIPLGSEDFVKPILQRSFQFSIPVALIIHPVPHKPLYFTVGYEMRALAPEQNTNAWGGTAISAMGLGWAFSAISALELKYQQQIYSNALESVRGNTLHRHQNALSLSFIFTPNLK